MSQSVKTVTVIGAGVIGASWSAAFAAAGCNVRLNDVREGFAAAVHDDLRAALADITADVDGAFARITYHGALADALQGADLVQENGPERPDFKQDLFAEIERMVGPDTILISSSSGIPPEVIGKKMVDPTRVLIGHPFNPPHLVPLVEICAVPEVRADLVSRAMDFYSACGKVPVRLNKPVPGFVGNRLQVAVLREAINLVEMGVIDVAGADKIMLNSLGIRWAAVGPLLAGQLGAGNGGIVAMIDKIMASLIDGMGLPPISPETVKLVGEQASAAYPLDRLKEFAEVRDQRQKAVMAVQKDHPLPTAGS